MYLTAISAVSIHNLVNNINDVTRNSIQLKTLDTNWTLHDDIEDLSRTFTECNGSRQSPIQIDTSKVKENLNLRLELTAYDKPISAILINQFPTLQMVPFSFELPRPNALVTSSFARSFNPQSESHFTLHQIQFFWSQDDNKVIHRVDNSTSPLEIHFIHLNSAYLTLEEAFTKPDGIMIFAVMATASTHESYIFDRLLDELESNLTLHGRQRVISEDSTWRSLMPANVDKFYRYSGSQVLPPCKPVQWIIFDDKLNLGYRQLKRLKRFKFVSKDLRNNQNIDWSNQRRPIQPTNGRLIEQSFKKSTIAGRQTNQSSRKIP